MKLIFTKDANNEVGVKIQTGTIIEDFSYIEMVRQLLNGGDFYKPDFINLTEEEKGKIELMLDKIKEVFVEETEDLSIDESEDR